MYDFELEPEVRDWLDSLSDSDFKRVDEVCGMLAERGTELGGPWSDHLEGAVWELRAPHGCVSAASWSASGPGADPSQHRESPSTSLHTIYTSSALDLRTPGQAHSRADLPKCSRSAVDPRPHDRPSR